MKSGRPVRENMNKSKERTGEETKNMNRDERREGDEGAPQKEATAKANRRTKLGTVPRTGTSGAREKQRSNGPPRTGTSGGTQWQADKHKESGLEHPEKNVQAGTRATKSGTSGGQKPRGGPKHPGKKQVALDWSVRGCTRRERRRRQEKREASQGEHEQEQGMQRSERMERRRGT